MGMQIGYSSGKDGQYALEVHGFVISGIADMDLAGAMAYRALEADIKEGVWTRCGASDDMAMFIKPGLSAVRWNGLDGKAFLRMSGFGRKQDAVRCAKAALYVAGGDEAMAIADSPGGEPPAPPAAAE